MTEQRQAKLRASPRTPTRDELVCAVRVLFPPPEQDEALLVLDQYPDPRARATRQDALHVQMTALGLSGGSLDRLRRNVEIACGDYRNILAPRSLMPWAAEYRAVEMRLGEAGLSPWAEWRHDDIALDGRHDARAE